MTDNQALDTITALSHDFGSDTYVRGGGGNTSCKNADTLFVKPSGVTLAEMTPEKFLALDRRILEKLYNTSFPEDVNAREAAVAHFMAATVRPGSNGRPSVEAPLHNSFPQRFVVHTHPAEVNGLTCANSGAQAVRELFPKALWVEFTEPGYTLCMRLRKEMLAYEKERGAPPELVFLGNHGLFVAHDSDSGVRDLYEMVMYGVRNRIASAKLNNLPAKQALPAPERLDAIVQAVRETVGEDAARHAASGLFAVPEGAISPDHIVYSKAYIFFGEPTADALKKFHAEHRYWPRVVVTQDAVVGFGPAQRVADLALELAWDGAVVAHYADAFGGVHFLEKRFVDFIENWEVENYRQKVGQ